MKITTTKTYMVNPINSVEEVRKDYDWVYSGVTDETVRLEAESVVKEVRLVRYDKAMTTEEILDDFKERGLKPASPNALLGFSKQYPDEHGWFVAPSSVFRGDGIRCVLYVYRVGVERKLDLIYVVGYWHASRDWVFLAEPLEAVPETLESSDTLPLGTSGASRKITSNDEDNAVAAAIVLLKEKGFKITKMIEKEY